MAYGRMATYTVVTNSRVLGEAFANISGKTKTKRESGK